MASHAAWQALVVIAPAIALDDHDVMGIDAADRVGDPPLQIPDRRVLGLVAAIALAWRREAPVGLVDQVVAADPRFILVARGEPGPQRDRLALILRALPQRRLGGIAVGDGEVIALAAGGGVQIENEIQPVLPAPFEQPVDALETFLVPGVPAGHRFFVGGQGQLVEMDRQAHRVEAPCRHLRDVGLGRVVVEPGAIKLRRPFLADQFGEPGANAVLLPDLAELQHIAFLQHPPAEPHAAQDDRLAAVVDDPRPLDFQKTFGAGRGGRKQRRKRQQDRPEFHNGILVYDV